MPDIGESQQWNEQEVAIEALDAPERGVALYLYKLGEKLHTTRFRLKPLAYLCAICVFLSVLLSGSAFLDAATSSPATMSSAPSQDITCKGVTTNPQHLNLSPPPSLQTFSGDVNINACSGDGHVIIISGSSGTSSSTPQPWHRATNP